MSSFCGQQRDEDEEHHFLLREGSLGSTRWFSTQGKLQGLQPSLCWQFHSLAQACGSFSRSQFIYSQVAFNLPITSCKNILFCVTNLRSVSRFQGVMKGRCGQPSSLSPWDMDRGMHKDVHPPQMCSHSLSSPWLLFGAGKEPRGEQCLNRSRSPAPWGKWLMLTDDSQECSLAFLSR